MAYRWLDELDQALEAGGVAFVPVPFSYSDPTGAAGWWDRGRPASTGPFDVSGVLCHHTASPAGTTAETELRVILAGNGDAPGPIAQLLIDRAGVVFLVAAGRANHGGKGRRPGVDVGGCADMNAELVGIEVSNNGVGERWPDAVTNAYADVVAALASWYGWPTESVYLHGTTGPPAGGCNSKIDPAGPWQREPDLVGSTMWNLDVWRQFVDEHRSSSPEPTPPQPSPTERRHGMSDFVVIYGIPDVVDGTVLELVAGRKRLVSSDEWYQVLKGVMAGPDGVVPPHDPWTPVASFTNGWYAMSLPNYDDAASSSLAVLNAADAPG